MAQGFDDWQDQYVGIWLCLFISAIFTALPVAERELQLTAHPQEEEKENKCHSA